VLLLVCAHQHGSALTHLAQQLQQHEGLVALQLGRGLVHHQQRRLGQRLAQDGHGTLLHGGQLQRRLVEHQRKLGEAEGLHLGAAPVAQLMRHQLETGARQLHDGIEGAGHHQPGLLLHQARRLQAAAPWLARVARAAPAAKTRVGGIEIGQRAQQGGFARSRRPQQNGDPPGGQCEVHLSQDDARTERCAQTRHLQAVVLIQSRAFPVMRCAPRGRIP
jgi:hypothetical protein